MLKQRDYFLKQGLGHTGFQDSGVTQYFQDSFSYSMRTWIKRNININKLTHKQVQHHLN